MQNDILIPPDFLPIVISSPSGAGKTTLSKRLLDNFSNLVFSVSHTTRKPRKNEIDGKDYNFVDHETFQSMITNHAFLEWATVHENLYGTSQTEIQKAIDARKKGIVFDVDHQGARQISAKLHQAIQIFILPPTLAELETRLRSRATDTADVIEKRYQKAKTEISHYNSFDYLIVNENLDRAYLELSSIIFAEGCKRKRVALHAEKLLKEDNQ